MQYNHNISRRGSVVVYVLGINSVYYKHMAGPYWSASNSYYITACLVLLFFAKIMVPILKCWRIVLKPNIAGVSRVLTLIHATFN